MLVSKTYFSPNCLIAGHDGPCHHKHCLMAHKKPQYFGISVAEDGFKEFTLIPGVYCHPHLIATGSQRYICELAGRWPDVKRVPREHVEFRWVEYLEKYRTVNEVTGQSETVQRPDVAEYAYYIGPENVSNVPEIDVNADVKLPEGFNIDEIYRPVTDWCHCGSEGDWCGEGCRQPQNKERVLSLEKGGRDEK